VSNLSQGFCTSYVDGPELEKLSGLRARTDRQILGLIHSKLDFGLNFVALVEEPYSDGNSDRAGLSLWRAEQTVIEVKQLLPVLTDDQYQSVGPKLNELQEALDRLDRNRERPRSNAASMS
jgi:hypothetical protein